MSIKDRLYNYFVRKNGRVWYEYERYVREHMEEHRLHKLRHLKVLFKLNWFYRVEKGNTPYFYWDVPLAPQKNKSVKSQNKINMNTAMQATNADNLTRLERMPIQKMVTLLSGYEIISFDMYDTLVFRELKKPRDVFLLLENWSGIPNFAKLRVDAESEARENSECGEVSIYDIYEKIEKKVAIDKEEFIKKEIELEIKSTKRNEYFYKIYKELVKLNKKIIVISNMYLPIAVLKSILENCGYKEVFAVFESYEVGINKINGDLFQYVEKKIINDNKVIHIGDNYRADIEGARAAGWKAIYYRNANSIIKRDYLDSSLPNSIYEALVNTKLYSGIDFNPYYMYGYANAGYLVYGYCKWLNQLAKAKDIEKLLFASRDMYIVEKIYREVFKFNNSEYVKVSRTATIHLVLSAFLQHYLDWHVKRRISSENTVGCVLEELGISFLKQQLEYYDLEENEIFCLNNYDKIKNLIEDNKDLIDGFYSKERIAAHKYFENIVAPNSSIMFVDLGWKSSSASSLRYFFNKINSYNLKFYSAMIGSEGHPFVERGIDFGDIFTYVFSSHKNIDIMNMHNKNGKTWRRLYEIIFTSNEQSLLSYKLNDNSMVSFDMLRKEIRDDVVVTEIHKGIYDFCSDYRLFEEKFELDLEISGKQAYEPLANAFKNEKYNWELFKDFEVCFLAGNVGVENAELFGDVSKQGVING